MNTRDINKNLKSIKQFKGTYCSDSLPTLKERPIFLICNTDPCSKPGQHWVAMSLENNKTGEYFDSFGFPPLVPEIIDYLNTNCPAGWRYSTTQLQSLSSDTCGNYCCFYVRLKANGLGIDDILTMFSKNQIKNDQFILDRGYKET